MVRSLWMVRSWSMMAKISELGRASRLLAHVLGCIMAVN